MLRAVQLCLDTQRFGHDRMHVLEHNVPWQNSRKARHTLWETYFDPQNALNFLRWSSPLA